ncbi:unnamed protein product [Diamesa serratosioi]
MRVFKGSFNSIKKCINSGDLFAIDQKLMNMFGFWSSNKTFNKKLYSVLLFLMIFDWIPKFNFLRKAILNKEYKAITLSIPELLITTLTFFIIQNFLLFEMKIKQLCQRLETQWKKSLLMENSEWMTIQSKTAKSFNKLSFSFKLMIYLGTFLYTVVPFSIFFFKYHLLGMKDEKFKVIMADFGFNWEQTILINICPIIVLFTSSTIAITFSLFEMLFMALINYSAAYFVFVQTKIRMLNVIMQDEVQSAEDDKMIILLKEIIIDHSVAIEFAKKLEETLSYLMLVISIVTTATVCFLTFHLSIVSEDFFGGIKITIFILVVQKDFLMFSYFGTKLMHESAGVGIEISNLPFYNIHSTKIQKYLILIMLRSQQPIGVTVGKFYHLNLKSFSEACNTILKYFTVLRKVVGKN